MIRMDQLCIGLHIKLDSWLGHPFLLSNFKIKNQGQIDALRSMGLTEIEYFPKTSVSKPVAPAAAPAATPAPAEPDAAATLRQMMKEKKEHIDTLHAARARIRAAEKKYAQTASAAKNIMRIAADRPMEAAEQAKAIALEMAETFLSEQPNYLHLMDDNVADESGVFFHQVNVSVLSLTLARALGINDPEITRDIAQGALLHDVGKVMIRSQVLLKDEGLTQAEIRLLHAHPAYGIKVMQSVESLSPRVREIILFHHEMLDGSGFPKGLKGDAVNQAVRVVSIANAYDNLCNQRVLARSRTPAEALAHMYKNELAKYDEKALSAFIKALGVYPPGTIVLLKSGRVGIVMSVDSADLLYPNLMVYDPSVPKDQAAIVNLRSDLDDAVDRTLRPSALPPAIHDYLSPRKRVCYFADNTVPT
jgi:HD-GYP domain-containing protein (c-di-GMP phosphodiesterase class II)